MDKPSDSGPSFPRRQPARKRGHGVASGMADACKTQATPNQTRDMRRQGRKGLCAPLRSALPASDHRIHGGVFALGVWADGSEWVMHSAVRSLNEPIYVMFSLGFCRLLINLVHRLQTPSSSLPFPPSTQQQWQDPFPFSATKTLTVDFPASPDHGKGGPTPSGSARLHQA